MLPLLEKNSHLFCAELNPTFLALIKHFLLNDCTTYSDFFKLFCEVWYLWSVYAVHSCCQGKVWKRCSPQVQIEVQNADIFSYHLHTAVIVISW